MKQAFSLVELSIVLVILGLLTGGILTGQSLIRAAELRSVVTQLHTIQTTARTFQNKYFALPGDMRNATDFWGEADADFDDCKTTQGTGTETCNGNGNGEIGLGSGTVEDYNESFRYWQHLANAGLIEGSYTGVGGASGGYHNVPGENVLASKLSNASWNVLRKRNPGEAGHDGSGITYDNTLFFGTAGTFNSNEALLSAEELWNLDTKIDDSRPRQGKVILNSNATQVAACTTGTLLSELDVDYDLTNAEIACAVMFPRIFK